MDIGQYYSRGGRNTPEQNLISKRQELYSELSKRKKNLATLEVNLNKYANFENAPVYSKDGQEIGIQDALKNRYNYLKRLNSLPLNTGQDFNIYDTSTYLDKTSLEAFNDFHKNLSAGKISNFSQTGIVMQKTLRILLNKFKMYEEEIIKSANNVDISSLQFNFMNIEKLKKEVDKYDKELGENYDVKKYFTTKNSSDELKSFIMTLSYWINFLEQNPLTSRDIGDVGEAYVDLIASITKEGAKAAYTKGMDELGKTLTGGNRVNDKTKNKMVSAGVGLEMAYSINASDLKFNNKGFKGSSKAESFVHNGFTYQINTNFDINADRQIKCDVKISDDIKASVKNWDDFSFFDRYNNQRKWKSLGETYILNALIRTVGISTTDDYIYAIQDNQLPTANDSGANIIHAAHDLAKISLLMDIAMGYSQKSIGGDASVLIINNRADKNKHWYVIDLNELLYNSLQNKTTKEGFIVSLEGYDEKEIEDRAWYAMKDLLNKQVTNEGASNMYRSMVYQQLHSKKIKAAFKAF